MKLVAKRKVVFLLRRVGAPPVPVILMGGFRLLLFISARDAALPLSASHLIFLLILFFLCATPLSSRAALSRLSDSSLPHLGIPLPHSAVGVSLVIIKLCLEVFPGKAPHLGSVSCIFPATSHTGG